MEERGRTEVCGLAKGRRSAGAPSVRPRRPVLLPHAAASVFHGEVKAEIALKKEEKPDEKMEAEDKQPPIELVKQDSSIMADPSLPDENQVQQPNPPDQQVPDTDMKEEVKQWPKDPISEIFKGRVK